MSLGIDYGFGQSNVDVKTGIRYGIIAQNSVSGDALNDMENEYPFTCPQCGNETLVPSKSQMFDYFCQSCRTWHMSEDCYGEESIGMKFEDEEYIVTDCLDSDLMVIKSPYYTLAQYCSPCVPGAGSLDTPIEDGIKAYCLGADWFDEYNSCPYPIYSVTDDSLIAAASE